MIVMAVMYFNKEETPYTSSSRKGDRVYLDILSIIPTQGIYTEGQVYYTEFVCECETTDHEEVKVFISSADYRRIFDADVNVIVNAILKGQLSLDLDLNDDGEVNIADVNQVIAVILS